jgi:dTDP-glucose 4,6-dehydratase
MKLLVTGGAGFIGSNFVRHVLAEHAEDSVVVLDKLTYAGRMENLADHEDNPRFSFIHGAIEDREVAEAAAEGVDAIINFAAESHVDRSIEEPDAFIKTDVFGTQVLLEIARERGIGRYLQISTDEVYGSIDEGSFTELSPIDPSSPYSASKAGGDMLVQAYFRTYGLPALITRASNNYGPYHYPEKLIPLCVLNAFAGDSLPVYGNGMQVRNWLHVEDHCRGIYAALTLGKEGEVYNIGGPDECPNIEVVKSILELTGRDESLIEYVTDRPGHDVRYSLASDKLEALGWKAQIGFEQGLADTVQWYRDNEWWWKPIRSGEYLEYYKRQYGSTLGD